MRPITLFLGASVLVAVVAVLLALSKAPGTPPATGEATPALLKGKVTALAVPGSPRARYWSGFEEALRADSAFDFTYFVRGELGDEASQLAALSGGRVHFAGVSVHGLASLAPDLSVLLVPYLFESVDEAVYVYDRHAFPLVEEALAARGLVLLQWVPEGWVNLYAAKPLSLPGDAEGLTLRVPADPATALFVKALGAKAGASAQSLRQPVVDGGSATVFEAAAQKLSSFTLTKHAYATTAIVADKDWFDSATPAQRQVLRDAVQRSVLARSAREDMERAALAAMTDQGVTVHTLTDAERKAWKVHTAVVHRQLIKTLGDGAQRLYDAVLAGKAAYVESRARTP